VYHLLNFDFQNYSYELAYSLPIQSDFKIRGKKAGHMVAFDSTIPVWHGLQLQPSDLKGDGQLRSTFGAH
jgi:hypothetical protein